MLFNSLEFVFFFMIVIAIYYVRTQRQWQLSVLVISSLLFYGWAQPDLILLLAFSIFLNAFFCWRIVSQTDQKKRLTLTLMAVTLNVVSLLVFKYTTFFVDLLRTLTHLDISSRRLVSSLTNLPIPLGISFFTLEGICLLVESYRKPQPATFKSFLRNTCTIMSFFPHLIAGPILRPEQFFPQVKTKRFSEIDWNFALSSLILGYFLKCFVSDNLASYTTFVAGDGALLTIVIIMANALRLFADFAGYSYIAIGLSALLGYRLPQNFNWPFQSQSMSEFWTRWNMTVSFWFRDYAYIPLGGNRKGKIRTLINTLLAMTLSGFWHGAGLRYLMWGFLHGLVICFEVLLGLHKSRSKNRLLATLRTLFTFSIFAFLWTLVIVPSHQLPTVWAQLSTQDWNLRVYTIFFMLIYSLPVFFLHCFANPATDLSLPAIQPASWMRFRLKECALAIMLFMIVTSSGDPTTFVYFHF